MSTRKPIFFCVTRWVFVLFAIVAPAVDADTVGWWRFDGTPGERTSSTLANSATGQNAVSALTAASINGTSFGTDLDYMPKYIDGFTSGMKIFDPVTGSLHDNVSSLRLRDTYVKNPTRNGAAYVSASSLPLGGSFTMECFFRVTETDPSVVTNLAMAPILTLQPTGYGDTSIQLYYGKFYGRITGQDSSGNQKTSVQVFGKAVIADGKWHHAAMSYDANSKTAIWYLDYVKVGSQTLTADDVGIRFQEDTKFLVGANGLVSGRNFPGEVDEVRFSNKVLLPAHFLRFSHANENVYVHMTFESTECPSWWGGQNNAFVASSATSRFSVPHVESIAGAVSPARVTSVVTNTIYGTFNGAWRKRSNEYALDMNRTSDSLGSVIKMEYLDDAGESAPVFSLEEEFTLEFFARFKTQEHVAYTPIVGDGGYKFRWGFFNTNDGRQLLFQVGATNKNTGAMTEYHTNVTCSTSISDGNWHHFALVYSRSAKQAVGYIDYGKFAKMPVTFEDGYVFSGDKPELVFGGRSVTESANRRLCDIVFDEIRITKRALDPEEFLTTVKKFGVVIIFK